ncbi:uncharacterized protein SPAPADRAFT_47961 [Spathaspora passalidarum NRRL Y-27907]|uniref:SET domain-containing protein n=1 Tax=Spathaspora passalidarum (strain NRRL Y-27907 / 11-Y1) TaxID=619300 RepID=G3AFA5_SPAPN|nr:uncharacterized protein SPAPADRAFT_47961 [Spathaspora passalidarum NRRL Y-27907]EGW34895.1 hypothetical protein SPAPADRAFT_47961 [Spathaspora passalidarum NRRL Y-27907]
MASDDILSSDELTLVDYPETALQLISPLFSVDKTVYGGRGCFAKSIIPSGTIIHRCSSPISSSIARPFKKEVCHYCFKYDNGKTWKIKRSQQFGKQMCSIVFCTEECRDKFSQEDGEGIYLKNLMLVEKNYLQGLKKHEVEPKEPKDLDTEILQEWEKVGSWEEKLKTMKPSKRESILPRIDESEYLEINYVIGALFSMYKYGNSGITSPEYFQDIKREEQNQFELQYFNTLQSTELEKVRKYPYLLYSYINIYKFLKLTVSEQLQPYINTDEIRCIIGRNLSNAFGIWSEVSDPKEDKEFLGFGVYPSASFFNHSCAPNLVKTRIGNQLVFTTLRDISAGEELCINYGNFFG